MVDEEGDLASSEKNKIHNSIENHKRWIEMAKILGCHSVRVNLNGEKILKNGVTIQCMVYQNFVNLLVVLIST